ncbi:pilus assembly protein TadG-related protein [Vibrio sp. V39_P1S14PM300]|uniref:pilus assembly protein TadG-related protein n=1 Tax=Vibrio sp. V39_P1S14PM300 TaxID=1938690 RepID=UPI0013727FB2|nr:pilus assembly protein TadG-related protein [Vibrio sp. V39_P1S14PM300]NAX19994.1 hypothetical protein [Vibrio sp. V39_P1S14PM300]
MLVLHHGRRKGTQKGITLVLISLIMLLLLGVAAFSLDLNHMVLNKTRLQNAVDSAALAGAVVADDTGDVDQAEVAAIAAMNSFATSTGNSELTYTAENIAVTFSYDYQTFVPAASFSPPSEDADIYVRVAVTDVSLTEFLSSLFGINKAVAASAVAGRSAAITYSCNITPMAVCGDPVAGQDAVWGYQNDPDIYDDINLPDQIHELKVGDQDNSGMGPGNFQLLDFGQGDGNGGGAALVRKAMSGEYNGCATIGDTVTTKPGNSIGPVAQGLNTRLNDFTGPIPNDGTVLPDLYVREPNTLAESDTPYAGDLYYSDYLNELRNCEGNGAEASCVPNDYIESGQAGRRILRIPIVNCTDAGGKTDLDVLGFGCFFLLQKVENSGQSSVFGQFLYDCPIKNGSTGIEASDVGLYRIQLYKDPLGGVS